MENIVGDKVVLPTNRILKAWVGKLKEVVVVGIDTQGNLIAAGSHSGARSTELLKLGKAEIANPSDGETVARRSVFTGR